MSENEKIESMDDYLDELEKSFKKLREGDIVKGSVIGVGETEVTVDLGSYAEGIVPIDELSNDPKFSIKADIAIGDVINAVVISADNGYGQVMLSIKRADNILAWDFLEEAKKNEQIFGVKIAEAVKGGAVTYLKGIRAFIPASGLALEYTEDTESFVGKYIQVRIIEVDEADRKLVLSAKSVLREEEAKKIEEKMSKIAIGTVVVGRVERLENYGAFVRLSDGLSGLVHISQMSEKRIKHPKEVVSENDEIKVMITDIKDGKLSLSITKAIESEVVEDTDAVPVEYSTGDSASTSFADLLKGIKL
ncbi:MAG: S1 RNA-binding domain-containing protein [Catonella sp.]|uniref:S1 RNA-binding domain-containing protein n=1 Tax=Catonella sp. TaxID=2382125 RepID=UPI003F9FE304